MKPRTSLLLAAGLLTGALVHADPARAQQMSYAIEDGARADDPAALEAQAKELYSSPKKYRRAAELHLQAAELREASDPKRVSNQVAAARLFYYDGDQSRARKVLERAANEAIAAGDVVTAADVYLDAASVAQEEGDAVDVLRLVDKARLLMASPLIDARDRDRILSRIGEQDSAIA